MNDILLPTSASFPPADDVQRHHAGHQILRALTSACGADLAQAQRHAVPVPYTVKVEVTLPGDLAGLLGSLTIHTWESAGAVTAYRSVPTPAPSGLRFELRCDQASADMSPERFCAEFDITLAEARVLAALVAGEQPKRYAQRRGLSIHTVRTQICALKTKMDCRRQIDLVRKAFALDQRAARPAWLTVDGAARGPI